MYMYICMFFRIYFMCLSTQHFCCYIHSMYIYIYICVYNAYLNCSNIHPYNTCLLCSHQSLMQTNTLATKTYPNHATHNQNTEI